MLTAVVVSGLLGAAVLALYDLTVLEVARSAFGRTLEQSADPGWLQFALQRYSFLIDATIIGAMSLLLYALAKTDTLPIAQGYLNPVYYHERNGQLYPRRCDTAGP